MPEPTSKIPFNAPSRCNPCSSSNERNDSMAFKREALRPSAHADAQLVRARFRARLGALRGQWTPSLMNLSGLHQRYHASSEGQGRKTFDIAFKSRPISIVTAPGVEREQRGNRTIRREVLSGETLSGWRASVWDEVCSTSDGVLRRTIKILITDGSQPNR
jgi:hypothetical protein